jgi:hypothetical protein
MKDGPVRIQYIPFERTLKPMKPNWGALVGALIFIGGILLMGRTGLERSFHCQGFWIYISFGGLLFALYSLLVGGRRVRRNWKRVKARCLDQEIFIEYSDDGDAGKSWSFILLCEFEFNGYTYRVTPDFWTTFITKGSVSRFLSKRVYSEGFCDIFINPDNPLQTEIVGRDIKDLLLHWPR